MVHHRIKYILLCIILSGTACKHRYEYPELDASNYPKDVGVIILGKCATSGCHNNASYPAAANLNLTTWDNLFEGANSGAVIIPYRPDYSSLCFFTNTDTSLGITLQPTMPIGQTPLNKEEYKTITNWIAAGAPNAQGIIKFENNTVRRKAYVANRMCDVVTVFDAASFLQMRYIDVGNKPGREFPYCIKVSPDKKHWYVSFFSRTSVIQKFSTYSDQLVGEIHLGIGSWTSFTITSDSRYGFFVDNSNPGKIAYADLETMQLLATYTFDGRLQYPSGIALNESINKMYVGCSYGNFIYNIDITTRSLPTITEMPVDGSQAVKYESSVDPVELLAERQGTHCYIACSKTNEIIVLDMLTGKSIARIPLGNTPANMALYSSAKKLLVSCPDDTLSFAGNRGAVIIIDLNSYTIEKKLNTGYQPYGIAIDEERKIANVANANISAHGPASHHASRCGEKNGNVTFIDLSTMKMIPNKKREVAVYPFSAANN